MYQLAEDKPQGHFGGILPKQLPAYWPSIEPLIVLPLKRTDALKYYSPDDVYDKCCSEEWQCWVAWSDQIDAVFVTYIETFPTGHKNLAIYLVGGTKIDEWLDTAWQVLKAFGKEHGCQQIAGFGRKGWLRKLKQVESGDFEEHLTFTVEI